jgi:hypothetical protein
MDTGSFPFRDITVSGLQGILRCSADRTLLLPVPGTEDTGSWKKIVDSPLGRVLLRVADEALYSPLPVITLRDILTFRDTGARGPFESPYRKKRCRAVSLAVAWCATRDRTFLTGLEDYLFSIVEETSWILPAHYKNAGSMQVPVEEMPYIDLGASMTGMMVAELLTLLRQDLEEELTTRLERELERRIIVPFMKNRRMSWMGSPGNWNAVCNCGVLFAALHAVEGGQRCASLVHLVLKDIPWYISGFQEEGGTSEGAGYWNYGFGHYCAISDLIERASEGELSLVRGMPEVEKIALFPSYIHIAADRFVNFSDANERLSLSPFLISYLRRIHGLRVPVDLPAPVTVPEYEYDFFLRDLPASGECTGSCGVQAHPDIVVLSKLQWYIMRSPASGGKELFFAAKGGNNSELHNHNDLGTFVLNYGGQAFIAELGKDAYRKEHFGQGRYGILSCSSEGHSVPIVNGCFQGAGRLFFATSRHETLDRQDGIVVEEIHMDLLHAYPRKCGLKRLERRFEFQRGPMPSLNLIDRVAFKKPGSFTEVFWTFLEPEQKGNNIILRSEEVTVAIYPDRSFFGIFIDKRREAVNPGMPKDAYRILFTVEDIAEIAMVFHIRPYEVCIE